MAVGTLYKKAKLYFCIFNFKSLKIFFDTFRLGDCLMHIIPTVRTVNFVFIENSKLPLIKVFELPKFRYQI